MDNLASVFTAACSTNQETLSQAQAHLEMLFANSGFGGACVRLLGETPPHSSSQMLLMCAIQLKRWISTKFHNLQEAEKFAFAVSALQLCFTCSNLKLLGVVLDAVELALARISVMEVPKIVAHAGIAQPTVSEEQLATQGFFTTKVSATDVTLACPPVLMAYCGFFALGSILVFRYTTMVSNRDFLDAMLRGLLLQPIIQLTTYATPIALGTFYDHAHQFAMKCLTFACTPIMPPSLYLAVDSLVPSLLAVFSRVLDAAERLVDNSYILLNFFINCFASEMKLRHRLERKADPGMKQFCASWGAHSFGLQILQAIFTCIEKFSMSLSAAGCSVRCATTATLLAPENVVAACYKCISTAVRCAPTPEHFANLCTVAPRILQKSNEILLEYIRAYVTDSFLPSSGRGDGSPRSYAALFSLSPKDLLGVVSSSIDEEFFVSIGSGNGRRRGSPTDESDSPLDYGVSIDGILDEIIVSYVHILNYMPESFLDSTAADAQKMFSHLRSIANARDHHDPQLIASCYTAITTLYAALVHAFRKTLAKDGGSVQSMAIMLTQEVLSLVPTVNTFLAARFCWFVDELVGNGILTYECDVFIHLPPIAVSAIAGARSTGEAFAAILLCKNLFSQLSIMIEFHKESLATPESRSALATNMNVEYTLATLSSLLAVVPSEAPFYLDLFETLSSALEVSSTVDSRNTSKCFALLLASVSNGWNAAYQAGNGSYDLLLPSEASPDSHPLISNTSSILNVSSVIYYDGTVHVTPECFGHLANIGGHCLGFLTAHMSMDYLTLLSSVASCYVNVFSCASVYLSPATYLQNQAAPSVVFCKVLLQRIVEFSIQRAEEYDFLPEVLPLILTLANYLGMQGAADVLPFLIGAFKDYIADTPDFLLTSRFVLGSFLAGYMMFLVQWELFGADSEGMAAACQSILAATPTVLNTYWLPAANMDSGFSTPEQNLFSLVYLTVALASLHTHVTRSDSFFRTYNNERMVFVFACIPRVVAPKSDEADVWISLAVIILHLKTLIRVHNLSGSEVIGPYMPSIIMASQCIADTTMSYKCLGTVPSTQVLYEAMRGPMNVLKTEQSLSTGQEFLSMFSDNLDNDDGFIYLEAIQGTTLPSVESGVKYNEFLKRAN